MSGPGGRDGYIHMDDAQSLLRHGGKGDQRNRCAAQGHVPLDKVFPVWEEAFGGIHNKMDKPVFEVHTWEKLTPFYNIAKMIDLMTLFIKVMLVAIVLVSIMDVMIMAVYERIRKLELSPRLGLVPVKFFRSFLPRVSCWHCRYDGIMISLLAITGLRRPISFNFGQQRDYPPSIHYVAGNCFCRCLSSWYRGARQPATCLEGGQNGSDYRFTSRLRSIMKSMLFIVLTQLCLCCYLPHVGLAVDGTAILQQVDRKMQPESYEMYRKLINIEPDGKSKEFVLYTVKKGQDKMVALVLVPSQ